jgi:hypothetical protein
MFFFRQHITIVLEKHVYCHYMFRLDVAIIRCLNFNKLLSKGYVKEDIFTSNQSSCVMSFVDTT